MDERTRIPRCKASRNHQPLTYSGGGDATPSANKGHNLKRITEVELYGTLDTLNTLLDKPLNGAEIGSYHFSRAYGGWQLHRTENASGGIRQITDGYVSKRLMLERMWAMIAGIRMVTTE